MVGVVNKGLTKYSILLPYNGYYTLVEYYTIILFYSIIICAIRIRPNYINFDRNIALSVENYKQGDILDLEDGVRCEIADELKKDFFNIYKGVAVQIKEVTHTPVTIESINFTFFNKDNIENGTTFYTTNLDLIKPTNEKIVFILHGWASSGTVDWVLELKDAFLVRFPNGGVIIVDWKKPASQPYTISSVNTYDVGNFVGEMVLDLVNNHDIDIKKFLLVGHSLGGQACGFAGKKVQTASKLLPRIIALDPAGPFFTVRPKEKRLNSSDAEVVEVIHSDGNRFGFKDPCGTIDFYPNGGMSQPGCFQIDLGDIFSVADPVTCDHQRSHEYLAEALVNPTDFSAMLCTEHTIFKKRCNESVTVALGDIDTTLKGNFYFDTNKQRPYAKKKQGGGLLSKVSTLFKH